MAQFLDPLDRGFLFDFIAQQIRITDDAGERVVQLVRNTRDKLAERGKFFGAYELVMQLGILDCDGEIGSKHFEHHHFGSGAFGLIPRSAEAETSDLRASPRLERNQHFARPVRTEGMIADARRSAADLFDFLDGPMGGLFLEIRNLFGRKSVRTRETKRATVTYEEKRRLVESARIGYGNGNFAAERCRIFPCEQSRSHMRKALQEQILRVLACARLLDDARLVFNQR